MSTMKQIPIKIHGTDWHSLGEIKLPAGPATRRIISAWLRECTQPLNLLEEFKGKILQSALEALERALEVERNPMNDAHVVMCLYAPHGFADKTFRESTWGFFRIEKAENDSSEQPLVGNSIELYLYPEGS